MEAVSVENDGGSGCSSYSKAANIATSFSL
jgi:hypothetical protein